MTEETHELDAVATALARRAEQRELDERDPEWGAVASGELDVDAAIERRRAAGDDEAEVDRAALYFRPFDADETASLVDSLLGEVGEGGGGGASSPGESGAPELEPEVVPLRRPEPKPTHDPGSSGFWWIPGGMLAAAAAAILAWWLWPPSDSIRNLDDDRPKVASVEPLPNYVLETDGGLKQLRGDTETGTTGGDELGHHRYQRDTPFEWILRPKVDEPGDVGVRGFAFVDGGSAGLPLGLDELAQIADSGAIRISGTIEQLDLEPGRYTIALAVGRPADLPTQAAEVHEPGTDVAWQVRRVEVEIED